MFEIFLNLEHLDKVIKFNVKNYYDVAIPHSNIIQYDKNIVKIAEKGKGKIIYLSMPFFFLTMFQLRSGLWLMNHDSRGLNS